MNTDRKMHINTEMLLLQRQHDSENRIWWEMQLFKAELYLKKIM